MVELKSDWNRQLPVGRDRRVQTARDAGRVGLLATLRASEMFMRVSPRAIRWLWQRRRPQPTELRGLFEDMGATYIKLGQLIASSPSLFPREYVEEFSRCLDRSPAIPFRRIRRIIETDLGCTLDGMYEWVDEEPLATASIAQVHAARMHGGRDVVIKVQKPGVQDLLSSDMNFLFIITRVVEIISPGMKRESITGIVEELYQSMLDECDFIKEANNLLVFREFLNEQQTTSVVVPMPHLEACGRQVLTMDRLFGRPLTDESVFAESQDLAGAVMDGLELWFHSLIACDFFHADLHNGNLLLLDDGRLGFIDFGLVGRVPRDHWTLMASLLTALGQQDAATVAHCLCEVGMTADGTSKEALARDIDHLFKQVGGLDSGPDLGLDSVNGLLLELATIGANHGVRFPRQFSLVLKQLLYFDRFINYFQETGAHYRAPDWMADGGQNR